MDISFCASCNRTTHSIRVGRAKHICGKCKKDKTLSDLLQREALNKYECEKCGEKFRLRGTLRNHRCSGFMWKREEKHD
jgi:predicted RNA-binding Zn-ribbon protein involved in translation (DUF1610 family)